MKKAYLIAAGLAALTTGAQANAATLISAAVTGGTTAAPTGTVWDTTQNSFYTVFLQTGGLGNFVNGTNPAVNQAVTTGTNSYLLAGEGYFPGVTGDSDLLYTLTLTFSDGAVLRGTYTPNGNTFLGDTPVTVGGTTYELTQFSWRRYLGDAVSAYAPTPGGDPNDYAGGFQFSAVAAAAVPEPASWAMMIGGFAVAGAGLRSRRRQTAAA